MLIVAAIIVDSLENPSHVLCAQRNSPPSLDGQWEFPGGKQESNELPEEALHREIREELGVEITLGDVFAPDGGGDWPLPNGLFMRLRFATIASGTPLALGAHHDIQWSPPDTLQDFDWLAGDRNIVHKLSSALQ